MTLHTTFEALTRPLAVQPTALVPKGRLRPPLRAILFDVYGTLLISASGDIDAGGRLAAEARQGLGELLRKSGVTRSVEDLHAQLQAGIRGFHERARQGGTAYPEVRIEKIWQSLLGWQDMARIRQFALAWELQVNPVWPMPGMTDLLKWCRQAGLRMGIVSNAQFYTPLTLAWFAGNDLAQMGFDPQLQIFSYEVGCAKPCLSLFAQARRYLGQCGITDGETLYVGNDMRNDMRPALQTGFQAVLFAGDRRSLRLRRADADCAGLEAHLVVTALSQLPPAIEAAGRAATPG